MKINLSFPATGCQKLIEINDELKVTKYISYIITRVTALIPSFLLNHVRAKCMFTLWVLRELISHY